MRHSSAYAALLFATLFAIDGSAAQQEATAPQRPAAAGAQAGSPSEAKTTECPLVGVWRADSVSMALAGGQRKTLSGQEPPCSMIADRKTLKIYVGSQLLAAMSYVVDRKQNPWTIDLKSPDGAMTGICRCTHDKLQVSVNDQSQSRPKDFAPERGGMVLVLHRFTGLSLFVIDADGGNLRPLEAIPEFTSGGSPDWSADGGTIAFDACRSLFGESFDQSHVLVVNADGSEAKDLGMGAMPSWSPDGKRITYTQYDPNRGVWIMDADGSNSKLLDADGWGSQWARKHNKIAYVGGGKNICIYDVDKDHRHTLLDRDYSYIYWGLAWSPDGQWIAFKGSLPDGGAEIAAVNVGGEDKGFKVLLPSSAPESGAVHHTMSWDGTDKRVLVSMQRKTDRLNRFYLLDFAAENPPRLFPGQLANSSNLDIAVSPDGKKLVFSAAPPSKSAPTKPYLLTPASAPPPNTEIRNGAGLFMLIDAGAVTKDGKLDPASNAWRAVYDALQESIQQSGREKLHARFFFARGVDVVGLEPKLDEHFKKLVADLDLEVIYVDSQARNDDVGWDEYVRQME